MATSAQLMRRVYRELVLAAVLWIVWGVGATIGKRLGIAALTADKTEGLVWFGFGGLIAVWIFVADCTRAILAAIRENKPAEG
ncbi:MAG: hypothetical protein WCC22_07830 [Terriglobales bacterium]